MEMVGNVEQAPHTGPGWQPLQELVRNAYAALDDMDDAEYDRFEALSDWRKVAYRYLAADCDQFAAALHMITGWPIVGNAAHRLNQGPRGLIDASGWTTVAKLQRRYRDMWHELGSSPNHGDDWGLEDAVSAIRQFPWSPFNTAAFRKMSWHLLPEIDVDDGGV